MGRVVRWLAVVVVAAALVNLCRPAATDGARASVIASVEQRLGSRAGVVELEWFEVHEASDAVAFEGRVRVSSSQPGDLHATWYEVRGSGRAAGGGSAFEVQSLQLTQVPDVPPEPRP